MLHSLFFDGLSLYEQLPHKRHSGMDKSALADLRERFLLELQGIKAPSLYIRPVGGPVAIRGETPLGRVIHRGHMHTERTWKMPQNTGVIGRLMAPLEVYAATLSRADIPNELKHEWFLCGDVPEKFWDTLALEPKEKGFRLTAFRSRRSAYGCFTFQIADIQVRFVLPLGGNKAKHFLAGATVSGVHLALARNNGTKALLEKFDMAAENIKPVLELAKLCPDLTPLEVVNDFGSVADELCRTATIPSTFEGIEVNQVHVVALSPL